MSDTYVYAAYGNLYINLTNSCDNDCLFCIRRTHNGVINHNLWLDSEAENVEQIVCQLPSNLQQYKEIVFCGFGEPTYRLDLLLGVGEYLKGKGVKTRLDTNGHGNLINGCDITRDIAKVIDVVSVSLNASDKTQYQKICNSKYGINAYDEMLDFAIKCQRQGAETMFSVVDCIGDKEIARCQQVADKVGIKLRVRQME